MATFIPASDVWTLGYDQFGRSCWRNRETQELRYNPPGQGLALPPRSLADAPLPKFPNDPPFPPAAIPRAEAFPMRKGLADAPFAKFPDGPPFKPAAIPRAEAFPTQGLGKGVQFNASALKAPEAASPWPASIKIDTKPRPSPEISRAEEEKQWSRKRDNRGEYYYNSVTGKSQFAKPDCLKKYTCRR